MKFWIKIIIALSVVIVTAFSVWAFFFREKEEVQAYNRTAELIDYKQSLGIRDKLIDLRSTNFLNNNPEKVLGTETEVEKSIHEFRSICLSGEVITNDGDISFYSYLILEDYVNELLEYYLPYTQGNKSKNKPLKTLKKDIEKYIKSLKELNETIDKVAEYQDTIEGSTTELEVLNGYYSSLHENYRKSLSNASIVVLSLVNYIDICMYSDDIKFDTIFALNDAYIRSLKTLCNVETIIEPDYAHDVKLILDTIKKYEEDNSSIFNDEYKEYQFVKDYDKLYNDYKDTLNYVYSCKNLEKQQMAAGMSLSNVVEDAQSSVIYMLNVIGF